MPPRDYFSRIRLTDGRRAATVLSDRFEVLFVCHANQCRSAMAERLANRAFADRIGVRGSKLNVSSAGTHARAGVPMHRTAAEVLCERRAYADCFGSRLLTPPILATPNLILTATREQRTACMNLVPSVARRTFTLRQFGRMVAAATRADTTVDNSPDALRDRMRRAVAARAVLQPVAPEDDDLADPVRDPIDAFRQCADAIEGVLDGVLGRLIAR